ncbi:MAG: class I SAM-dependent rRNA methyltransferase [Planctomycetes bacterium]|nr:class I SAM-dependent rRNA methyltransferase [Planctomycetota bacterium]
MASPPRTIRLTQGIEGSLRGGHPWAFADAVALAPGLADGEVVDLLDRRGEFVARGTVEPRSPLAFRAWTLDPDQRVDAALVVQRLAGAIALRRELLRPGVTGFRACHGENDHLPGLQCDLYGDVASLRTDGALGVAWEERFVGAVQQLLRPRAIVVRNPLLQDGEARVVAGTMPAAPAGGRDGEVVIEEHGRRFFVDVLRGQKTGFFLDQRENRDRVAQLARGRRVLNTFAYTGGFSVAAAQGGAAHVTTVDLAAPAVETARRNFALNGLDPAAHSFLAADAFDVLAELAARATGGAPPQPVAGLPTGSFDLIVLDPPSFAHSRKMVPRAEKAYEKLNELALRALPPGGWLATASCSSHVREADFLAYVATAAVRARRRVTIAAIAGAAPDHPARLGFPEGRYLKFALLRAE